MRARVVDAAVGGVLAAQLVGAAVLTSAGGSVALPGGGDLGVTCLSRGWLGVHCPMCGMTRSFVACAHGDVAAGFAAHPAGPLLFVTSAIVAVAVAIAWARSSRPMTTRPRFVAAFAAVALLCVAAGAGRHLS